MFEPHVFVSYAHEDRRWFEKGFLMPGLIKALETMDQAEVWYDRRRLAGGDPWQKEIEDAIDRAHIAILLVSTSFIVSEFIQKVELPRIAQRAKENQLIIIPILVGYCQWNRLELLKGPQMIPGEPTPLVEYRESEAKWEKVQHEILSDIQRQIGKARNRARNKETVPDGPIALSVPPAPPRSGLARPSTSTWTSRLSAGVRRLLYGSSSEEQVSGEMTAPLPSVTPEPQGRPVPVQRSTTGTPDATSTHVPESLDHQLVGPLQKPATSEADNPQSPRGDGMTARPGSIEVSPDKKTLRSVQDRVEAARPPEHDTPDAGRTTEEQLDELNGHRESPREGVNQLSVQGAPSAQVVKAVTSLQFKHEGMGSFSENRSQVFGKLVVMHDGDVDRALSSLEALYVGGDTALADNAALMLMKFHPNPRPELIKHASHMAMTRPAGVAGEVLATDLGNALAKGLPVWDEKLKKEAMGALRHVASFDARSDTRWAAIKALTGIRCEEATRIVEQLINSRAGDAELMKEWHLAVNYLAHAKHQYVGPAFGRICGSCSDMEILSQVAYWLSCSFFSPSLLSQPDQRAIFDGMLKVFFSPQATQQYQSSALQMMIRLDPARATDLTPEFLSGGEIAADMLALAGDQMWSEVEPWLRVIWQRQDPRELLKETMRDLTQNSSKPEGVRKAAENFLKHLEKW
jgi:hypothetical protein